MNEQVSQPQSNPTNAGPLYTPLPPTAKKPYIYSRTEQILAGAAVLIGIFFQFIAFDYSGSNSLLLYYSPFFVAFALLNRRTLKENKVLLFATILSFLLTCAGFTNSYYNEYEYLSALIMPCLLIALGRYAWGNYKPKEALEFILMWTLGMFIDWLTAIHRLPLSFASLHRRGSGRWKLVLGGLALGGGMLMFLLPLMATADSVFSYFISSLFGQLNYGTLPFRLIAAGLVSFGSYSLLWNSRFQPYQRVVKRRPEIPFNPTIVGVSFAVVLAVYALFCGVQFTYLFAGVVLPQGMSYSEYAVSGFWELVQIACINLALFGLTAEYGPKNKLYLGLQLGLLATTGVMLASAILRLNLYILAYNGMTWLRLISMWFLIYMAAVLVLCVVRLFVEKFPVVTVSALLILAWWVVLGFASGWLGQIWPEIFHQSWNF